MATVLLLLMATHQSVAHMLVMLRASCSRTVVAGRASAAFHTERSSTRIALEMCLDILSVMSLMNTTKRVGGITSPCCKPPLILTGWIRLPSSFSLAVLCWRKLSIHLCVFPATRMFSNFSMSLFSLTLSNALERSTKTAIIFLS